MFHLFIRYTEHLPCIWTGIGEVLVMLMHQVSPQNDQKIIFSSFLQELSSVIGRAKAAQVKSFFSRSLGTWEWFGNLEVPLCVGPLTSARCHQSHWIGWPFSGLLHAPQRPGIVTDQHFLHGYHCCILLWGFCGLIMRHLHVLMIAVSILFWVSCWFSLWNKCSVSKERRRFCLYHLPEKQQ